MIILSFESKNKAREYFNFILSNASIKTETIILNDFAYQYDYEICIYLSEQSAIQYEIDVLIDKLPTEKDKDNLYILLNEQGTK